MWGLLWLRNGLVNCGRLERARTLHIPKRSGAPAEGPDAQDRGARRPERGVLMTTRGQSLRAPGSRRAPVLPGVTCYLWKYKVEVPKLWRAGSGLRTCCYRQRGPPGIPKRPSDSQQGERKKQDRALMPDSAGSSRKVTQKGSCHQACRQNRVLSQ